MAELNVIKFSNELQKQLFPDNAFYKKSRVESGIAINATSVEIPIAGDLDPAGAGEPSLPLAVKVKTDTKKSYPVTLLYTDPWLITRESEIVTNYNKHQETVEQLGGILNTRAADTAAYEWGPTTAARIAETTGDARPASLTGATGSRKRLTKADVISVNKMFEKMNLNIPGGKFGLITPDMHEDLLLIDQFVDYDKTGNKTKLEQGFIGKLLGIEFFVRWNDVLGSSGLHYSSANVKKVNGDVAATDCAAGLFWHSAYTRHAEGNAHTSINRDKAEYLGGTLMSSTVRFGATQNRSDEKGVIALIEDNA